jgi:hypothetical protein
MVTIKLNDEMYMQLKQVLEDTEIQVRMNQLFDIETTTEIYERFHYTKNINRINKRKKLKEKEGADVRALEDIKMREGGKNEKDM